MPQLVLELRYCSHREQGVEMGLSINLFVVIVSHWASPWCIVAIALKRIETYQCPPLTLW